jgi:hypothetical protein
MSRVRVPVRTSDGQRDHWEACGRMLRSWSSASMVAKPRFKRKSGFVRDVETLLDRTAK